MKDMCVQRLERISRKGYILHPRALLSVQRIPIIQDCLHSRHKLHGNLRKLRLIMRYKLGVIIPFCGINSLRKRIESDDQLI